MTDTLGCLTKLRIGHSHGKPAINKPCLLLAIICEIQAGHISSNRVTINDRLMSRYHDIYEVLTGERHKARPWLPLWHLRGEKGPCGPLWSPEYLANFGSLVEQLGQPKSLSQLKERFVSARLDSKLFSTLQGSEKSTLEACALLTSRYLSSEKQYAQLQDYLLTTLKSGEYEKQPELLHGCVKERHLQYARSAAFRSLVLEAYDYRCAASRLRYITPDYRYLVEAAHLIPFAVSQDDRPANGLALTPNLHWAMDNHLIAPGPDQKWHVSPAVDALVPDNHWLCKLDGYPLALPRDSQWQPASDALAWRLDNLLR